MAKAKTWAQMQAATIEADLRSAYGRGWDHLSESQRSALVAEKVLFLVLSQVREEYAPARNMAREVLALIHPMFKPE